MPFPLIASAASYFAQPIIKYLSIAVVALLLLGGFYWKGRSDGYALSAGELATQKLEWQQKVNDMQLAYQDESFHIATQYESDVFVLQSQIEKLKKNPKIITKYIPAKVDTLVPTGLVTLHDRAAEGVDLDDDVANAEIPSDVRLSVFGGTVAENYLTCEDTRKKLVALQDVVREYQEHQQELLK